MKVLSYGKDYKYLHGGEENFMEQEYLLEQISGSKLFKPKNNQHVHKR